MRHCEYFQFGIVIRFDNHVTSQHGDHFGNRRFSHPIFAPIVYSLLLAYVPIILLKIFNRYWSSRVLKMVVIKECRGEIFGTEITGQLKWHVWLRYVFQLGLKVWVSEWIFLDSKKAWSSSSLYFLSIDTSADCCDANCRKNVHGVVLVYRLISRQPLLCVFDDAFNLSVYHSNTVV